MGASRQPVYVGRTKTGDYEAFDAKTGSSVEIADLIIDIGRAWIVGTDGVRRTVKPWDATAREFRARARAA